MNIKNSHAESLDIQMDLVCSILSEHQIKKYLQGLLWEIQHVTPKGNLDIITMMMSHRLSVIMHKD